LRGEESGRSLQANLRVKAVVKSLAQKFSEPPFTRCSELVDEFRPRRRKDTASNEEQSRAVCQHCQYLLTCGFVVTNASELGSIPSRAFGALDANVR